MNMKTAMRWFEKASEHGEVTAMSMLCFMHYKGHVDQTKDFLAAAKWCRKAADAGDAKAQYNLGVVVAHGQGLEQDFVSSYQALSLSPSPSSLACWLARLWLPLLFPFRQLLTNSAHFVYSQWLTLAMHRLPEESLAARNSLVTKMSHEEVEKGQTASEEWLTSHRMMRRGTYAGLQDFWRKLTRAVAPVGEGPAQ